MKRCPECRRDYYDDTLSFCLDDGTPLVDGAATAELATAILPASAIASENVTWPMIEKNDATEVLSSGVTNNTESNDRRSRKKGWLLASVVAAMATAGLFAYIYFPLNDKQSESVAVKAPKPEPKLYWHMTEAEQMAFIQERAKFIQTQIGDEPTEFDAEALKAIKIEIDDYVSEKDSLSQKPYEEGLRVIYGRASQYAPMVIRAYEGQKVPPTLGLYQAMIESEYHDCPSAPMANGPVGMFQFSRRTAAKYGLSPSDYCNVEKQSDAAARYMSDLISDFGEGKSNSTLGLLSYMMGENEVRDYLRQLRGRGITERSFWALFRYRRDLDPPLPALPPPLPPWMRGLSYVPRFFAAAIIGETPVAFELSTPPLTTLGVKGK